MSLPARYLPALDAELRRVVDLRSDGPPLLYGMLRYHLGWVDSGFRPVQEDSGKRIRPVMLLLAAEASGGDWQQALPAAAAVELLHNFTLIHDDIEDRDTLRRGRATLWSIWGIAQAINAGDALFALSYLALLELTSRGTTPERVAAAAQQYTEAVISVTEGQCLDLAFEEEQIVDEAVYLEMIRGKTAALMGLAAELGGIIAGAPEGNPPALREFGEALGMAFQMNDDILGLWGDPAATGKPVASDIRKGKKTLPILHGLTESPALRDLLVLPAPTDVDVQHALKELDRVGSRAYAEDRAAGYHRQALEALDRSGGAGNAQQALRDLVQRLVNRAR